MRTGTPAPPGSDGHGRGYGAAASPLPSAAPTVRPSAAAPDEAAARGRGSGSNDGDEARLRGATAAAAEEARTVAQSEELVFGAPIESEVDDMILVSEESGRMLTGYGDDGSGYGSGSGYGDDGSGSDGYGSGSDGYGSGSSFDAPIESDDDEYGSVPSGSAGYSSLQSVALCTCERASWPGGDDFGTPAELRSPAGAG